MASESGPQVRLTPPRRRSPEGALAARLLEAHRERDAALGSTLFDNFAWDMILSLFVAQDEGRHMTAAALCANPPGSAAPARRLLKALEEEGMVVRMGDAVEDGRAFVYLSGDAARRVRTLLRSWL